MGFAALTDTVPLSAWIMLLANIFWTVAYDTKYAMVDRDDDLKIGIRTSAITFGRHDVLAVMSCYAISLLLLVWAFAREGHLKMMATEKKAKHAKRKSIPYSKICPRVAFSLYL